LSPTNRLGLADAAISLGRGHLSDMKRVDYVEVELDGL
jgi:hypothetical protein